MVITYTQIAAGRREKMLSLSAVRPARRQLGSCNGTFDFLFLISVSMMSFAFLVDLGKVEGRSVSLQPASNCPDKRH